MRRARRHAEQVSCNGNLLINIGPTASGTIPAIFEERLRGLGDWMRVNGRAIYDTKPWIYQNDTLNGDVWYTSRCGVQCRTSTQHALADCAWEKVAIRRVRSTRRRPTIRSSMRFS